MAQTYTRGKIDTLLTSKADKAAADQAAKDAASASKLVAGYITQTISASTTLAATTGTYDLTVTADATLTMTAENGTAVTLIARPAVGKTLTIAGTNTIGGTPSTMAITAPSMVTLLKTADGWVGGAASAGASTSAGTGATPGTGTTPTADTTAPTAPMAAVKSATTSSLTVTVSGGTDAVGVTQYRAQVTGGSWVTRSGAGDITLSGLTAGTSYTISAQAGDAAGNWSPSTTATGSTSAATSGPTTYASYTNGLAPVFAYDLNGNANSTGSNTSAATLGGGGAFAAEPLINEYSQSLKVTPGNGGWSTALSLPTSSLVGSKATTVLMLVKLVGDSQKVWGHLLMNFEGETPGANTDSMGLSVTPTKALRAYSKNITIQGADGGFSHNSTHLVGLRFDGSTMSLWLDGSLVGSTAHTATVPWTAGSTVGLVSVLNGFVQGMRIWTTPLTDAQMLGAAKAAGVAS